MAEKKRGLLVNLIKKSVGLPTGSSSCCGDTANAATAKETAGSCCLTAAEAGGETAGTVTKEGADSCCGSAGAKENAGGCCTGSAAEAGAKGSSCCG